MKIIHFIPFLILMYNTNCFAQKNYSDGYIISLNDDTIYGKIKNSRTFGSYNSRTRSIRFIDKNGKNEKFLASKIKGYSKSGILNFLTITDLNRGPFFAQILIKGPLTLLSYTIDNKYGGYMILILKHINKKSTQKVEVLDFKNGMANYISDYPELSQKIINKELRYADIEIIVREYNEWYNRK